MKPHIKFKRGYWRVYWRNPLNGAVWGPENPFVSRLQRRSKEHVDAQTFCARLNNQRKA